jgi:hypothetical protein
MFKLIGFIVVCAVLAVGYPSLQRWYLGDSTPKQTVDDIRLNLGSAINPNKVNTSDLGTQKNVVNQPVQADVKSQSQAEAQRPMDTESAARDLLKKAIE